MLLQIACINHLCMLDLMSTCFLYLQNCIYCAYTHKKKTNKEKFAFEAAHIEYVIEKKHLYDLWH